MRLKLKRSKKKGKSRIKARLQQLTEQIVERRRACATPDQAIGSVAGTVVLSNDNLTVVGASHPAATSEGGLKGVTVAIEGWSHFVKTDSAGQFNLSNAPAGPQTLQLSFGGQTGSVPITVVAGATIYPGSETRSRQDAFNLVKAQVLDSLPNANTFSVQASQNLIPKGVRVATEDVIDVTTEAEIVKDASWLFFVDLFPNSAFGHPTKIILVNDLDGTLSVRDEYYQPILNDHPLWLGLGTGQLDDYLVTPSVDPGVFSRSESSQYSETLDGEQRSLLTPIAIASSIAPLRVRPRDHVANCPNPKTYAIYITGTPENAFIEATVRFAGALSPTASRDVAPTNIGDFRTLYKAAFNALNAVMTPCDTLVVYAASHGAWDDDSGSASGNIMYKRSSAALGNQQTQWIGATDLIFPIRNLNACHLEVIVDACFAGSMLADFRKAFNFNSLRDTERIAVVAADATSSAVFAPVSAGSELFGTTLGGQGHFTSVER